MATFNFTPGFGNAEATLNNRKALVKNRDVNWYYKKYAYINLTTATYTPPSVDAAKDSDSVFDLIPRNGFSIGQSPAGGFLSLYTTEKSTSTRKLKKHITSATVTLDGGGDLYNSFIREWEINFKVYTMADLELVENDLFKLGATAVVEYGWIGSANPGEKQSSKIKIYNFGYTMNADGSFDCNIKALEGDAFAGATRIGGTIKLTEDESKTLSEEGANPANLSMALIAKYKTAHGLSADEDASDSDVKEGTLLKRPHDGVDYYMLGIKEHGEGGWFDDPIRVAMVRLKDIVDLANKLSGGSDAAFDFDTNYNTISPATKANGSADPRKFICPGQMAWYGADADFQKTAPQGNKIEDILVSITYLTEKFDSLSTTVNEKQQPPVVSKLLKSIGTDLKRLTGGLVDLQVITEDPNDPEKNGSYLIFNNTEVQKLANPNPFVFSTIGEDSIVKDVSIDTEFDMDTMLMMTVGNVKSGAFRLAPLQKVYTSIPNIDIEPEVKEGVDEAEKEEPPTKGGIGKDGIDDERASAIASSLAQALAQKDDGTMVTIPLQIKLSVKLDGIDGINFLAPITVDRLPKTYKNNVKFLVTAVEHSFDGDGGWETDIKTAMKVGN